MSFTIPQFPLTCEIFTGPWLARVSRGTSPCNLAIGRRGVVDALGEVASSAVYNAPAYVLFPPLTDVRDLSCNIPDNDLVEIPQGSGRWYSILLVDDVGKGFSNEHRYAVIAKISQAVSATFFPGLFWPTPIP